MLTKNRMPSALPGRGWHDIVSCGQSAATLGCWAVPGTWRSTASERQEHPSRICVTPLANAAV
jgi:hypothetical protein